MKHVIYYTEFYSNNGTSLRAEESDAYFNTIQGDYSDFREKVPPIGCRLLQPKLVPSRLTKEQWEHLCAKKPDYELKYASLCDGENGEYSIYAIFEKWLGDEDAENTKSLKITILIFVGIAATIFLIWSFVKLYDLFDGFILFFLFGGIMWIGAIIGVWAFVKESIEDAINKCKSEIKHLRGKW